ncbi:MAG: SDR family NAD(P)-dependent oxidoreductase [Calditrichia bacterium]
MNLKNKVALITGSAVRVGKATAMLLAERGAQVIVHYRSNEEEARQTAKDIEKVGVKPLVVQGDVSKIADWQRMREEILAAFGRVDILVNNAAIFYPTPFLESDEEDWDSFMNINLKSVYLGCRLFGELMVEQKSGKIVNIVDVSSERVWKDFIPYCVSKAGVAAITKGLAKALAPHVTVNAVSPGTVLLADEYDAELEQRLIDKTPLQRVGSAKDIAETVRFVLEASDFITGANIPVDGGRSLV